MDVIHLSNLRMLHSWVDLEEWEEAVQLLKPPKCFCELWDKNPAAVKWAWKEIEANSKYRLSEIYRDRWRWPDVCPDALFALGEFLAETEHRTEAALIFDRLILENMNVGRITQTAECMDWRARLYWESSDPASAIELLKQQVQYCVDNEDTAGRAAALNNQALILDDCGEWDQAMELFKESERLHRETSKNLGLAANLCNQARLLHDRLRQTEALEMLLNVERIAMENGNDPELARSLLIRTDVLTDLERGADAHTCAKRGYALAAKVHDKCLMVEFQRRLHD